MDSKIEETFRRFEGSGLIKSTDAPVHTLSGEKKAALNRRGNEFFNAGEIESARRIFVTTGYSDGLSRVGDWYLSKGREIDALKLFWLAHNRRKADPLIEKLANVVAAVIETKD